MRWQPLQPLQRSWSPISFPGPISEVRVARINGSWCQSDHPANGNCRPRTDGRSFKDNIVMVEGEMKEVSEADMLQALKFAHDAIKVQCQAQVELVGMLPEKSEKLAVPEPPQDEEQKKAIYDFAYPDSTRSLPQHCK